MWRDEQNMPSKSQIAFALEQVSIKRKSLVGANARLRIELVKEATPVVPVEDTSEAPRVVLERLDVLNLNEEDITGLRRFNLEGPRQVVDLSQIDVLDIVGAVVVADLSTCPVETFDLNNLAVLDGTAEGN